MNKYLKLIVLLLGVTAFSFGVHSWVLKSLDLGDFWLEVDYSLESLYVFGFCLSLSIGVLLHLTDFALPKFLSFVFLGCVFLKAIGSYLYIKEGLGIFENDFLELNFLVTFFVFLFFDVFVAYTLVNQELKVESD